MIRPALPALLALGLFAGCAAGADDDPGLCQGKCDGAGPKVGLLYAPQYEHSQHWKIDGEWGLDQARVAATAMADAGWGTIEVVPVAGVDEILADLDARAVLGLRYDLVGTVSHGTRGGPAFDDTTDVRDTVQFGWSWFGADEPISQRENGGPVDIDGLKELTTRLDQVVAPDGRIVFFGCNTGAQTVGVPRSEPVTSAYKQGTPFFIEGESPARRYKTYVHAIADLTGRLTQGSNTRMSLGLTTEILQTLYYGGEDGGEGLPRFFVSVLQADAKADALDALDPSYAYDADEGVYVAEGDCDELTGECATADESWDRDH